MRIVLDNEKCQGHGRCYSLAPGLFDSDDEGYAVLTAGGTPDAGGPGTGTAGAEVPAGLEKEARLAADNCPEYAITLED